MGSIPLWRRNITKIDKNKTRNITTPRALFKSSGRHSYLLVFQKIGDHEWKKKLNYKSRYIYRKWGKMYENTVEGIKQYRHMFCETKDIFL